MLSETENTLKRKIQNIINGLNLFGIKVKKSIICDTFMPYVMVR